MKEVSPPPISKPHSALIVVGHGSTVNPDSSAPTRAHAETIRRLGIFGEVQSAFHLEEPKLSEVLGTVKSPEIYVVPNFLAEGYFTQKVIPRVLKLAGPLTVRGGQTIKYCSPVGNHPGVTAVLLRRAAGVAPGVPPAETSLVIVGHGTGRDRNSAAATHRQAQLIGAMGLYREVLAAFMEEPPFIRDWPAFATAPNVVVVPFFIADGLHSFQDIPVLMGIDPEPDSTAPEPPRPVAFRSNPHRLQGREVYYASAIGTEPSFAEVILDQVRAFDVASGAK